MAVSSSLNSIQINPRTPKTPRSPRVPFEDREGVELTLLGEEERDEATRDLDDVEDEVSPRKASIGAKDKWNMVLLYLIQGVPLGLALGSVPFLLREHLSYSQLATFSLASYPYSLKLLWSPIVDSVYIPSIGRRKSWIIPMQFIVGSLMLYISLNVQKLLDNPADNIIELSTVFTSLVFFSATQDIAVDGWALTLLSQDCLSYASTCQTIGLNTGFFASFTVFLAFNSEAFAAKWHVPHLTLSAYLKFWSIMCYAVTFWLLFFKKEDKEPDNEADMSIKAVYKTIWTICRLRHVQILVLIHLVAKIGFAANEAVTGLKMVEKGFKREDLALVVLIDFPFQIMGGWLAAKWSRGDKPLRPWLIAFLPRLALTLVATLIVLWFPTPPISTGFFLFLIIHTVLSSFASTVQFVGISAFHTRISDPLIGGTYMTVRFSSLTHRESKVNFGQLLNTFTNMGGTWPKWFVLKGVDLLSDATCKVAEGIDIKATECVSDHGKAMCKDINGVCITHRDGYYAMSALSLPIAVWRLTQLLALSCRLNTTMSSTTMHFGPEWMRAKQTPTRPQAPSPPPNPSSGASTYSALLSPAPPQQPEKRDETHPFRYSREELLRIYREGGGKGSLGLEVERWEGVVREVGTDPIGLREMGDVEKKLFQGPLNSDLRRRQSSDLLSPLNTQGLANDRSRHNLNSPSSAAGSPMRDRFGSLRREQPSLTIPRKQSLSNLPPASPRDAAPSPRRGSGFASGFDGVLGGSESWVARRRASEASLKANTGTSREAGGTDHPPEGKTTDIREEEEDQSNNDRHAAEEPRDPEHTTTEHAASSPSLVNGAYSTVEISNASLNVNGSGAPAPVNRPPASTSPAATVDLASVEWSYKDPSGQIQGPFKAELMQKWFEDGYFTGDLPVKRTHLDTQWATVDELVRRHGGTKIFVVPPIPVIPPGLPLHRDSQGQDPLLFSGPYQPAPIRNLRSSTLDSFGSNPSDSPSSSFGAGRFGNGSPDPSAFGGRGAFYGDNVNRAPSYGLPDPSNVFNRRSNFNDISVDPSLAMRTAAFNNVVNRGPIGDGFGYTRTYSPSQAWNAGPLDGNRNSIDPFPSPFGPTSANIFGPPQDVYGDGSSFPNGNYNSFVNGPSQPQHYAPSPATQYQQPPSNSYGLQASTPQTVSSDIHSSPAPSQSPWSHDAPRRGPFDSAHPTASNTVSIPSTVESSPWGPPSEPSRPSSQANESLSWQPPSNEVAEDWKTTTVPDSLTFSNLGQHNEQQQQLASAKEQAAQKPEPSDSAVVAPVVEAEAAPEPAPKPTTSSKSKSKTPSAQPVPAVKVPETPVVAQEASPIAPPATPAPKAPWAKEDEGKAKPSGISMSLRDIQEDEAKKAEARKAAERERERAARATAPVAENKDAGQAFTASWGLPTSQAGSRPAASVKETAASTAAAAPVWTNAAKVVTAKKTMKEIQEEEERRKKTAAKEPVATVAAAAARRLPADATQKVAPAPPASQAGGAWTTIGANGKHNAAALPARPAVAPPTAPLNVPATARPKANVPTPRPASVSPAVKTSALSSTPKDEVLIPPSSEFMKWLSTSLKGLNNSVNVDEIMEMLISFPVDADQATTDIVADIIYSNSTTLDGRRFAAEFFAKRKADAAARPNGAAAGKSANKPVSIADVVKATPKPAQPEWGFKVVNKKKKGGRA
ncbi:hypothetical protein H0H92_004588 [Tricholoma furcatifolium]|nr:hypothetical protein H0H92_004588 [Tricholoma furcatifolium]